MLDSSFWLIYDHATPKSSRNFAFEDLIWETHDRSPSKIAARIPKLLFINFTYVNSKQLVIFLFYVKNNFRGFFRSLTEFIRLHYTLQCSLFQKTQIFWLESLLHAASHRLLTELAHYTNIECYKRRMRRIEKTLLKKFKSYEGTAKFMGLRKYDLNNYHPTLLKVGLADHDLIL